MWRSVRRRSELSWRCTSRGGSRMQSGGRRLRNGPIRCPGPRRPAPAGGGGSRAAGRSYRGRPRGGGHPEPPELGSTERPPPGSGDPRVRAPRPGVGSAHGPAGCAADPHVKRSLQLTGAVSDMARTFTGRHRPVTGPAGRNPAGPSQMTARQRRNSQCPSLSRGAAIPGTPGPPCRPAPPGGPRCGADSGTAVTNCASAPGSCVARSTSARGGSGERPEARP